MKLYFSPGACSLAAHIVCEELELPYEAVQVDLRSHQIKATGQDYRAINPKGYVPFIDDAGFKLAEDAVILQYLASKRPDANLFPAHDHEQWRGREWLNFIATELHKGFGPIFHGDQMVSAPESRVELKSAAEAKLAKGFAYAAENLANKSYLLGSYSVVDAYLFTIVRWTAKTTIKPSQWPALQAFVERMNARPAVQKTLLAEGLR